MKRFFAAALLAVTACPAFCQNVQDAGYGLYGGSWVPLYASASGASFTPNTQAKLYGKNSNGKWYGIAVDQYGNLSAGAILGATIPPLQIGCLGSTDGTTLGWLTCSGGGSMTWPASAGIVVYGGSSAWGTSLTAPTGSIVGAGQANTYTTGLQDFSSATMKLPASYTIAGPYTITQPAATGTLALTSQIPAVGTWGALNYPSWASGAPFVKMTAAGTFSLDTTIYQAALTNPVTGPASPSAGFLTKWGPSGDALVDGLKFGTMTDTDWCTYTAANGLQCTSAAPGGGGSSVGTAGQLQMVGLTAGSFAASSITDNGTTVSTPENFAVGSGGTPTQISTTALPIANLPAASTVPPVTTGSNTTYTYKQVLDGTAANDCTVGGSSNLHWCYSNGTTWMSAVPATVGTVTNIATTTPIGGGPITGTGTLTCTTCVVASSPGAGIAHFAGSTQTVTSAAVSLTADVSGVLPLANGGTNNASLTFPSGTATVPQTICSGTVNLGTSLIASGSAATTVTATCTGLATTDVIALGFNGSPLAVTGYVPSALGILGILAWPTSGTINVSVFNNTGSSITPGAITLNYRVTR